MSRVDELLARVREAQNEAREELLKEREELLSRLVAVNAALSKVGGVPVEPRTSGVRSYRRAGGGKTKVAQMFELLAAQPGLSASAIFAAAGVHADQLYVLSKQGRLRREGTPGSYRYFLPSHEEAAQ